MQNDVDVETNQCNVPSNRLTHAALDTIPLYRIAEDLSRCKTNTRAWRNTVWQDSKGKEVRHRSGEMFTAGFVNALIIRMFAQAGSTLHPRRRSARSRRIA